jgi:hypothetical protein
MANNSKKFVIIFGVLILVIFVIAGTYFVYKNQQNKNPYIWNIEETGTDANVFIKSSNASKISVAEVDFSFNQNTFSLASASAGGFFINPLIVNWDLKKFSFALSSNPGSLKVNQNSPIIKLHFTKIAGDNPADLNFKVLPTSQIYVNGIGGVFPK